MKSTHSAAKKEAEDKEKKPHPMLKRLDYALIFKYSWCKEKQQLVIKARVFYYLTLSYKVSHNNLFVVLSTTRKQPVFMLSSGLVGYKHSKKTTELALRALTQSLFEKIQILGFVTVHLYLYAHGSMLFKFLKELKDFLSTDPRCFILWVDFPTALPLNGTKRPRRIL